MAQRSMKRLCAALALVTLAAAQNGRSSCPCVSDPVSRYPGLNAYKQGNYLRFKLPGSSEMLTYPATYGGGGCQAHDNNRPPSCDDSGNVPSWCATSWCYVDPNNCNDVTNYRSRFFRNVPDLHFSFATCTGSGAASGSTAANQNDASSVAQWNGEDVQATRQMIAQLERYTRGTRHMLEGVFVSSLDSNETSTCGSEVNDMCSCTTCQQFNAWSSKLDFSIVGTRGGRGASEDLTTAMCMSESVYTSLTSIAARESDNDRAKVGYMYYADQMTGTYTQWPMQQVQVDVNNNGVKEDTCDGENPRYDPRFRPWYAAGATGPKDVVIVVDVSGSMSASSGTDHLGNPLTRSQLAKAAVKAILNVLTWKDFVSIVLFNHGIHAKYPLDGKLAPVTESKRAEIIGWVDSGVWETGMTRFDTAFDEAFNIIQRSVDSGDTSMCQKAILFLTDGEATPPLSNDNFGDIRRKSIDFDTFIFTYSLGARADTEHMRRIACENRGVYYRVDDGADLGSIMAGFYDYFVQGQELCSASFVKYESFNPGQMLYAGCLPMYNRTSRDAGLLGVTCMDVDLIANVDTMRQESGWDHFICQASDMTKQCRPLDLTECHRQKIRMQVGPDSVCPAPAAAVTADQQCPCTDASCQDNPDFIDEKHYFCDTWIGDNCDEANTRWGYSAAGKAAILQNCRRSCGQCPERSPQQCAGQRSSPQECTSISVRDQCRACVSKASGVDIEGNTMETLVRRLCPNSPTIVASGAQALAPSAAALAAALAAAALGLA